MGSYTIKTIADALGLTLIGPSSSETSALSVLLTDSRQLSIPSKTIFFALQGLRRHGHAYVRSLYNSGVRNFVVEPDFDTQPYKNAFFLKVPDTLHTLQRLAGFHRNQFSGKILAITGSNGKTIVKEWLYELLKDQMNVFRSPKSYNSQIGVPLSLWELDSTHDLAIIEAGISKPGEMKKLASIINPDYGLFTNLGSAHDEGFSSRGQKLEEKLLLFEKVKTLFFCRDHEMIFDRLRDHPSTLYTWGEHEDSDLKIKIHRPAEKQVQIDISSSLARHCLSVPFSDLPSIENALHACSFVIGAGYSLKTQKVRHLPSLPMRMEVLDGQGKTIILHDAYNFDLTSLHTGLHKASSLRGDRSLIVILTDMEESGHAEHTLYARIGAVIKPYNPLHVLGIGPKVKRLKTVLPYRHFECVEDCLKFLASQDFQNHLILVKGARKFRLERIAYYLQEKTHETILEINLDALTHNYQTLSGLVPKGTKILVMIKADAYGGGAKTLGKFFEAMGADYMGVAYIDEGIALRQEGIKTPIMVLNPEKSGFDALIEYDLEPEIYSFSMLRSFIDYCESNKITDYPIHIKLDTGMRRLGFEQGDMQRLKSILESTSALSICSLLSHLASADDPMDSAYTHRQFSLFRKMSEELTFQGADPPLHHLLNSHGVVHYPQYAMDMIRLGIGLYGYLNTSKVILQAVHRYKAKISQVKNIGIGDTVGYNRKGKGYDGEKIATVSIGYADGLVRALGNGNYALRIRDTDCPTVGQICMDMCMIDVTGVQHVEEQDEVIVFGPEKPLSVLAKCAKTIPYEILTNISSRAKRIYIHDS